MIPLTSDQPPQKQPLRALRKRLLDIDATFRGDRITEADVIDYQKEEGTNVPLSDGLKTKVEKLNKVATHVERLKTCRSAGDVFLEFAPDAAMGKVVEMISAATSETRQRAQESILEYALGKPINRSLSLTMNIPSAREEEIDSDIRRLMAELGYTTGEGASSSILIGTKGEPGFIETGAVETESGVSGEVQKKPVER